MSRDLSPNKCQVVCSSVIWPSYGKIVNGLQHSDADVFPGTGSWWRCEMEKFPCYWPFVWGIQLSQINSPHKGQWRGALMFSFICAWINGWVNNREAGDLRHYCAHYAVLVKIMFTLDNAMAPKLCEAIMNSNGNSSLTHWSQAHICMSKLCLHWFR